MAVFALSRKRRLLVLPRPRGRFRARGRDGHHVGRASRQRIFERSNIGRGNVMSSEDYRSALVRWHLEKRIVSIIVPGCDRYSVTAKRSDGTRPTILAESFDLESAQENANELVQEVERHECNESCLEWECVNALDFRSSGSMARSHSATRAR